MNFVAFAHKKLSPQKNEKLKHCKIDFCLFNLRNTVAGCPWSVNVFSKQIAFRFALIELLQCDFNDKFIRVIFIKTCFASLLISHYLFITMSINNDL